jgi:hypothetical protein
MRQQASPESQYDRWSTTGNGGARFRTQNIRHWLLQNSKTGGYGGKLPYSSGRKRPNIPLKSRRHDKSTPSKSSNPHSLAAPK